MNADSGPRHFPAPAEVPALTGDLVRRLAAGQATPALAFRAHRSLVEIHPFNDGNGRVGRRLMNLFLMRGGYPPIAIRPEDRVDYLRALEGAEVGDGAAFDALMDRRLEQTLDLYIRAAEQAIEGAEPRASKAPTRSGRPSF